MLQKFWENLPPPGSDVPEMATFAEYLDLIWILSSKKLRTELNLKLETIPKKCSVADYPFYLKTNTWWSGYCDPNKGECDLSQSKNGAFVKRVAKNNSWNNGDRHKIHEIFLIVLFS